MSLNTFQGMIDEYKERIINDPLISKITITNTNQIMEIIKYFKMQEDETYKGRYIPVLKTEPYWHIVYVSTPEYEKKQKRKKLFSIKGEDTRDYKANFQDFNSSTTKRKHALEYAKYLIKQLINKKESKGMYIYSKDFQIGKTYLVNAMTNELSDAGITGIFIFAPSLVSQVRNFEKLEPMMKELKECEVLVIDDIGSEFRSEWFRLEVLTPVLQSRLTNKKTTIFTSNYEIFELRKLYMQISNQVDVNRIMSRILELCNVFELDDYNGNGKK